MAFQGAPRIPSELSLELDESAESFTDILVGIVSNRGFACASFSRFTVDIDISSGTLRSSLVLNDYHRTKFPYAKRAGDVFDVPEFRDGVLYSNLNMGLKKFGSFLIDVLNQWGYHNVAHITANVGISDSKIRISFRDSPVEISSQLLVSSVHAKTVLPVDKRDLQFELLDKYWLVQMCRADPNLVSHHYDSSIALSPVRPADYPDAIRAWVYLADNPAVALAYHTEGEDAFLTKVLGHSRY